MGVTLSKPGEKGQVPVGVIVGSVIGGLLLLAAAIATLWKVGLVVKAAECMHASVKVLGISVHD